MAVAHTHDLDEALIDSLDWLSDLRDKRAEGIGQARENATKMRVYADEVVQHFFTRDAALRNAIQYDKIAERYVREVAQMTRILQEFGR